jgi:hypothetical protein
MEVSLKTIVVALASASLLAMAAPAMADSSHHGGGGGGSWGGGGGGWGRGSSAAAPSSGGGFRGGFQGGSVAGPRGFGASHFGGRPGFRHFGGFAPFYFADFGLGFALGMSAIDPWFYDGFYGPYYDAPYAYSYGPPPGGYYYPPPGAPYPPQQAAPQGAPPTAGATTQSQQPAACGSWSWDAAKQAYNWVPC